MYNSITIKVDNSTCLQILNDQHAEPIFKLADDNRPQLREWLSWVDQMDSVEFIKKYITDAKIRSAARSDFAFVILYNNKIVGRIGVYKIDHHHKIGEIGYWLAGNNQGKGIATKACEALINYCFNDLDLNRLEIKCGNENFKSQAIPERLNFKKEGIIKQGELIHGKFIDLYLYALTKEEYRTAI